MALKRILKNIVKSLSSIEDLKAIVLYGSFARGDFGPRSDIDLFLITTDPQTSSTIQNQIIDLNLNKTIQPTIRTIEELKQTDSGLLQNVFQEGKIIYLKEPLDIDVSLMLKKKPFILYTFTLENLDQKHKAKFNRELYQRKSDKYSYKGLLENIGGKKMSSGCILVSRSKKKEIEKFFTKFKVKAEAVVIWK